MKNLIAMALLLVLSMAAHGKDQKSILEVNFEQGKKSHQFSIFKDSKKKNSYIISFVDERKKIKSRQLSYRQFDAVRNEANRLLWENQYRKPASYDNCKEYMTLRVETEKTRICQQNINMTGKSFGFLNSLSVLVR